MQKVDTELFTVDFFFHCIDKIDIVAKLPKTESNAFVVVSCCHKYSRKKIVSPSVESVLVFAKRKKLGLQKS